MNIQRTNPHSFFTINNSPLFIITNSGLRHIELNLHFILYPPVTQPSSIGNSWNGEFAAAHSRKKDTANLTHLQYPLILSEYEPTSKGCALRRPPITEVAQIAYFQNGEFTMAFSHLAVYVFESVCEGNFLYSSCERKRNKRKRSDTDQSGFCVYRNKGSVRQPAGVITHEEDEQLTEQIV